MVEIRFAGGAAWTPELAASIQRKFVDEFPGPTRAAQQVELTASVSESGVVTSGRASVHAVLLPSADGTRLRGIGDRLLSVHALQPYPGWEALREGMRSAYGKYSESTKPTGVASVGIRYIDRVVLPSSVESYSEYFVGIPARPNSMPRALAGFHVVLHARDEDGTLAIQTLGSAPPEGDKPVVLYDLNLVRRYAEPIDEAACFAEVEALHIRQREIFEDSITDKTRLLFS